MFSFSDNDFSASADFMPPVRRLPKMLYRDLTDPK